MLLLLPLSLLKCIDERQRFLLLRIFRFQVSQFNWYWERKRKMKNLSGIPITGGVRWKINRGRAWKRLMTLRILAPISHGSLVTRNAPSTIIESGTNKECSGVLMLNNSVQGHSFQMSRNSILIQIFKAVSIFVVH